MGIPNWVSAVCRRPSDKSPFLLQRLKRLRAQPALYALITTFLGAVCSQEPLFKSTSFDEADCSLRVVGRKANLRRYGLLINAIQATSSYGLKARHG
jgi:hypothetical protein